METLISIISLILLLVLISVPIVLFVGIKKWYRLKFDFLTYLILGLLITAVITGLFAWWAYYSNIILLQHYGAYVFNTDSGGYQVSYENILPVNIDKVKSLEASIMGIGWPLKVIMSFIFYSPYLLIVYFFGQLISKMKRKNKEHAPNN